MSTSAPSTLSLVAAAGYFCVVIACIIAAFASRSSHRREIRRFGWAAVAVFFALLALGRLVAFEEWLRDDLRQTLRAAGEYEGRWLFQLPLTLGAMLAGLGLFVWLYRSWDRSRGRRDRAWAMAKIGVAGMGTLIVLRTISFSLFDKLLYGPLKLNWVGDIGSALLVLGAAIHYAWAARHPR